MLGIKIGGQFLALFPEAGLTFEEVHPVGIITEGINELQGSYTLPIELPIKENADIIGHIDRLDVDQILMQNEYCEVWVDGLPFKTGKATIKGAGNNRAKMFIIFNEAKELTDLPLSSVDLGGDRNIGADTATRLAHALDTATNPLNHDYIFTPVLNPLFTPIAAGGLFPTFNFQNFWDHDADSFYEGSSGIATPFIRVDYLLTRIFREMGYTLDNQWQTTDELKLLLLYNNYSIYINSDTWSDTINLTNHVPHAQALDFVKAVVATFALCLFPDHETKTMLLIPFKTLIESPVTEDWTSKAAGLFDYETSKDFISILRYDIDTNDELSVAYSGTEVPPGYTVGEGLTVHTMYDAAEAGLRYAIADNTYYVIGSGAFETRHLRQEFRKVVKDGSEKEYISPLIPLWNSWQLQLDGEIDTAYDTIPFQQWQVPHIRHKGFNGTNIENYINVPCTSFRTMFYRGFQPADVDIDEEYPFASTTAYNMRGDLIGDYSLLMDREQGIYNRWWKLPYEMLASKKTVTRTLLLTIRDLYNFRFRNKYRIENQNVFFTRLRYTIRASSRGPFLVEATMVTTL